jgi:hypothetical protein
MANAAVEYPEVDRSRGIFLTVMTVLFIVLAFSDFTKAYQFIKAPESGGLVMFGHKFHSVAANAVLGPLFGLVLVSYAIGIWKMRSWVLPLAIVYAFYVPLNLVLYWFLHVDARPSLTFILIYLAIALTGSVGTAIYLAYNRAILR